MKINHGDCLDVLRTLEDNSVDSIVTDPPYGLSFMGKKWDYDVPSTDVWRECLRVLKPGGHALIACGTRTQHRMAVNIEDAGFEIRDVVTWLYGSGFPKSLDVSKAIDKAAGAEREVVGFDASKARPNKEGFAKVTSAIETSSNAGHKDNGATITATEAAKKWQGWGTALKPACEFWTLARKPLGEKTVAANVLKHGTGGINVDGCRVSYSENENIDFNKVQDGNIYGGNGIYGEATQKQTTPLFKTNGRFPANLILDEEAARLLDEQTDSDCSRFFYVAKASKSERNAGCEGMPLKVSGGMSGTLDGTLKTGSGNDRNNLNQNCHPTVKPIKLMRYLCKLITPPNGIVLDPFMGSGSTGVAATQEHFDFIGIEREAEYVAIAEARISRAV
jgi:DNA modification methylase